MILISSERNDFSTNDVIEWLFDKEIPFLRINKEDRISIEFRKEGYYLHLPNGDNIPINEIKSFWYRRGKVGINREASDISFLDDYHTNEVETLNHYLNKK